MITFLEKKQRQEQLKGQARKKDQCQLQHSDRCMHAKQMHEKHSCVNNPHTELHQVQDYIIPAALNNNH